MPSPVISRKPPRRQRQPRQPIEVRREQVLDAALRLIDRQGYSAATMEAIAREADVAKPVVYAAYPGRGPLLRALLEREERRGLGAIAAALPDLSAAGDFDTLLEQAITRFLTAVAEHPVTWRLMLLPADGTPDEVRDHVDAGRAFALERIRSVLRLAPSHSPGLAGIDLDLAAYSLLAVAEQAARLVLTDSAQFSPARFARFARGLLDVLASPDQDSNPGPAA
jgi:AcrR family transcriptional regulator